MSKGTPCDGLGRCTEACPNCSSRDLPDTLTAASATGRTDSRCPKPAPVERPVITPQCLPSRLRLQLRRSRRAN